MLQHMTPRACGSVKRSVVHFTGSPLRAYSLKRNNRPYRGRSRLHPNVFEVVKKHGVIFS